VKSPRPLFPRPEELVFAFQRSALDSVFGDPFRGSLALKELQSGWSISPPSPGKLEGFTAPVNLALPVPSPYLPKSSAPPRFLFHLLSTAGHTPWQSHLRRESLSLKTLVDSRCRRYSSRLPLDFFPSTFLGGLVPHPSTPFRQHLKARSLGPDIPLYSTHIVTRVSYAFFLSQQPAL